MRPSLALLFPVLALLCGSLTAGALEPRVVVSFKVSSAITLGEPVIVEFRIENGLDEPVTFDVGEDFIGNFSVRSFAPNRTASQRRLSADRDAVGVLPNSTIKPHGTYSERFVLNQWLEFDQVGTYALTLTYLGPLAGRSGPISSSLSPRTTTSDLSVLPKDSNRLRDTCSRLAAEAVRHRGESSAVSATALSYVRDPIAVPFLLQVARGAYWQGLTAAIEGLSRIEGPDAREALQQLTGDPRPDVGALARAALAKRSGRGTLAGR